MGSGYGTANAAPPPRPAGTPTAKMSYGVLNSPAISGGVINGKATSLPKPTYPATASSVQATGSVSVQVTIDETGKVISATPVSGHPLLRAEAAKAASAATFAPTMLSGQPVKVTGIITYNFVKADAPAIVPQGISSANVVPANSGPPPPPSAEALRQWAMKEKLHSWVYAVVARLKESDSKPGVNESSFVRDGKATVIVTLADRSPETLEKLRALGFEVESLKNGVNVTGRIPIEKLAALAAIDEVSGVMPGN